MTSSKPQTSMLCSSLQVINGELHCVPLEMMLMVMTAGDSVGENAIISPLAWTSLGDEVLLIMERPKNCTVLFDYIDRQIDEGLAKEFMRQLVEAAIHIHKAGVFHRDLKPENILIEYDEARLIPRVRIIDFGCGCFMTPGYHGYVGTTELMLPSDWEISGGHFNSKPFSFLTGTSCYQPPESNTQGTYEAGPTTVWQLGCILLQLMSKMIDLFATGMQHCEHFLAYTIMELEVSEGKKMLLLLFFINILQLSELVINECSLCAKGHFSLRLPSSDCKKFLKSCFLFNPDQRITLEQMRCHPWFSSSVPPEAHP
uniref:non-specific serine/threonine protein kinase n=1 Tax=Takifugu rubripes TaxID=31033 RepID=A0A674N1J9_TAKRU